MPRLSFILLASLLPTFGIAATCNADNCLRALRASKRLEDAQSFCLTYTTAVLTATSGIPSYATAACTRDLVSQVSSACSCIATTTLASSILTESSSDITLSPTTSSSASSSISTSAASDSSSTSLSASSTAFVTSTTSSAPTSSPTGFPPGPKICSNTQLSCQNTTVVEDLCCFNSPGGQLLQTQFWDTGATSTGPNNSWTLHGLWPDHCDGTYDANCDPSREYTNITAILQSYGKVDTLADMNTYWKDYQGDDESFWEHEWDKHGTCISTLSPSCYNDYTGQEEVADYFDIAVKLFKQLDSYSALARAGIVPSTTATYTMDQIESALTALHGFPVTIMCSQGALDEIWYHFNVRGSVQTGEFVPTSPDGSKSDCPTGGIKYVPKYLTASPTTTTTGATSTPTGTPYLGKGFLQAYTSGANKGCLISAGTWYTTGTCATYTATTFGDGFTLSSSKGPCDIIAGAFSCATGNSAGIFTNIEGSLGYSGSSDFYAAAVPVGSVQQKVYATTNAVEVSFVWQSV